VPMLHPCAGDARNRAASLAASGAVVAVVVLAAAVVIMVMFMQAPVLFANPLAVLVERPVRGKPLGGHQRFQCRQPVPVIGISPIRIAPCLRLGNGAPELLCPFPARENALLLKLHREGERLRLPGLPEDRPPVVHGHALERARAAAHPACGSMYSSHRSTCTESPAG